MCQVCGGDHKELVQIDLEGEKVNACIPCATERKKYCPWGHGWLNGSPCNCSEGHRAEAAELAGRILGGQDYTVPMSEHITERIDALCIRAAQLHVGTANPNKRLTDALFAVSATRRLSIPRYTELLADVAEVVGLLYAAERN